MDELVKELSFFEVLNIIGDEKFNNNIIDEKFKKLSLLNHPDKFGDSGVDVLVKRFSYICLSYFSLKNRKFYDLYCKGLSSSLAADEKEFIQLKVKQYKVVSESLAQTTYKEFIDYLKIKLKIISPMTAQTALGLYYEFLDLKNDRESVELYIDPEEIKPKISLFNEILLDYIKIIGTIVIIYIIIFIISYLRI